MSDVKCPYCDYKQEINQEEAHHNWWAVYGQTCPSCKQYFEYRVEYVVTALPLTKC